MKRILIVLPSLDVYSGVANHVMNYYRELRSDFKIDFAVYLDDDGKYREEIKKFGGKIFVFKKGLFSSNKEIEDFFKNNAKNYDIIHCHTFNYGLPYLKYAKKYGIESRIIHAHNTRLSDNIVKHFINRILIKRCKRFSTNFVACSKQVGDKIFGKNYVIINNAFSLEKYKHTKREEIRKKIGVKNEFLFGTVGRLVRQKNPIFLLEIFRELKKTEKYSNSKLLIIGDGKKKKKIIKFIRKNNLEDSVIFAKNIHDIYNYYSAMDCFIFPSKTEGLGMALVEAQASGLECFCTNTLPEEVFVTKHVHGLSLAESPSKWAREIEECKIEHYKNELEGTIFDIKIECKNVRKFYENLGRKKILHIMPVLQNGGTERYLINLLDGTYKDTDNTVLVYDSENYWQKKFDSMGVKCIAIVKPSKTGLRKNYQLVKKIIVAEKPDIVYSYTYFNAGITSLAACRAGVKTRIVHVHTSETDHKKTFSYKIYCVLSKVLIKLFATDKLACSKEAGKTLFYGRFQVIENGINLKDFEYNEIKREEVRNALKISSKDIVFGIIGRLDDNKNQKYAIDVFEEYYKRNTKSKLLIIGSGPKENELKKYVKNRNVVFIPATNDIAKYYSALDILLVTSKKEGLPFVCIEAQANGLSVLSSVAVSPTAKINDNFDFMDISEPAEKWVEKILSSDLNHVKPDDGINKYSIEMISNNLKRIYNKKGVRK